MPVIGAIDGHVRAGGLGLVGACDIVVAGPRQHLRADRGAHRGGAVDHLADAAAEDDRARRGSLLPDRREVRRRRGRRDRSGHHRRRRRRGDGGGADRRRSRKGSPQGLAASKALTTAPILAAFDRDADELTEQSARAVRLRRGPRRHAGLPAEAPAELGRLTRQRYALRSVETATVFPTVPVAPGVLSRPRHRRRKPLTISGRCRTVCHGAHER